MGYSSWTDDAYKTLSNSYSTKSASQIFSKSANSNMSPFGLSIRESRDSDAHPESLAIMISLDVTGIMGRIPESIIRKELGTLMNTLIENGISHPQVLFTAIGDHHCDDSPLQVGQFESSAEELDLWLRSTYLEGGGGGQMRESYLLTWLIGGRHTSIDCFEKRNQKGFLITIGDEMSWDTLSSSKLKSIMGYSEATDVTDKQLLEEAQRLYNVYHIHVNEGSYENEPKVLNYWKELLNERLIVLNDYHTICATIATLIGIQHGVDISSIVSKFDDNLSNSVKSALAHIKKDIVVSSDHGIIKL